MNGFDCTFHDLRHTFATFMIGAGVDVRTVASYLGHSSVSMTLNTYADVDPEAKLSAVDKIEAAFDIDGFLPAPRSPNSRLNLRCRSTQLMSCVPCWLKPNAVSDMPNR